VSSTPDPPGASDPHAKGVVLVGPRGAGKTTVGRALAARLGLAFLDTDRMVEEEAGRPLAELWAEGTFREHEAAVLCRVLAGSGAVVAAGGGAVLWNGFRAAVRGWAVVWLDAAPEVLARRLRADPTVRPSLTGRAPDEEIEAVALARAPLYEAVAWRRVRTDRLGPDGVADEIVALVRARGPRNAD